MDSDDEMEEVPAWKGVPGCIVLINVHDPSCHNTAEVAHAATCLLVRQYLRAANNNYIGVCLYGTEESNSSAFGINSVVDIFPLCIPSLDDFKKLRSTNVAQIKQAKELNISDVLWHCSKMFANCKKMLSSRTILLLSRLDVSPSQSDHRPALKRVRDLVDANIQIKIVNISESDYKIDEFYQNFLVEANKGWDFIPPKPVWDSKEIEQWMHQQSHRHLAVAKLSFEIGDGVSIGVGVYNLIKSQGQVYKKTNLDSESNAVISSITKTVKVTQGTPGGAMDVDGDNDGTTEMPLLKSELLHYQVFGGERVEFTDSEMKILKNPFGPPMMKLLGFKPASVLSKEKWFLKTCHFLFPNESIIEGSTVAFKALHKACTEMSMVAICVLCTRVNAKPKIVALSPCTSPLGLDVEIGFDIIQLPFVENVREVPVVEDEENSKIPDAHKSVMEDILSSIKFDYHPNVFENPKTQSLFRAVEAIALEEDDVEPFVDTTKPDQSQFDGLQADLFEEIFGPFGTGPQKRAGGAVAVGGKRKKEEGLDGEALFKLRLANREVDNYTVPQLKEILKPTGVPLGNLKKPQLVGLVYEHFEEGN